MLSKLRFLSLLIVIFLLSFSSANAQTTSSAASRLKDQMQLIKNTRTDIKQQIKDAIQAKREETKAIIEAKREEFKIRLAAIQDEKKKALVSRIDAKLSTINTKHTERFAQVLSNLQALLDKVSLTATNTSVLADIATAQAAIDAAKTGVATQAAKTYTITISTEIALSSDVGKVISQLRKDLVATHKLVIDAKQAVQKLNTDKSTIKKEATSSANL